MVGCVVLDAAGQLVGEGYHERFGEPHAEVNALAAAGQRARGGTLYVTLEPCSHYGKTPPCAEAVIAASPARVVAAMVDPNPEVAGRGLERLQAAGIATEVGTCERDARLLNAAFLKRLATGRPLVTAKYAMTLDGRIAARTGHSKWISGEASRALVHRLRGQHEAILTGIGTVLADDPLLTARPPGPAACRRFVIDPDARTPPGSQLFQTATAAAPVTLLVREGVMVPPAPHVRALAISPDEAGNLPPAALLDALADEGIATVFIEAGGGVLGRFFDAAEIDVVHVFIAPKLVGGRDALGPFGGQGREAIPTQSDFASFAHEQTGEDVHLTGLLKKPWLGLGESPGESAPQ